MQRLLWITFAFLLLVNLSVLGHSFYNRQQAEARVTLSERELHLPGNYGFNKENSGLSLSLSWAVASSGDDVNAFAYNHHINLSQEHYASLGFKGECGQHEKRSRAEGYVLLEFNGAIHKGNIDRAKKYRDQLLEQQAGGVQNIEDTLQTARKQVLALEEYESRLYVADAAASKTLLQMSLARRSLESPGEYLIVPALMRELYRDCDAKEKTAPKVYVSKLLVQDIYVPHEYHSLFANRNHKRHFLAEIVFGKLNEPWIESLQLCNEQCD
jgi:hypothetical protein